MDPRTPTPAARKRYEKPQILHVEKIEVRAVVCAKTVGDDFCELNAPTTS